MKTETTSVNPNHYLINALRYCSALAIVYVIFIFALPASKAPMNNYHLTAVEYHILLFVLSLPTILIWYAAYYGVAKLQEYAGFINKTSEGRNLGRIANGANWIAWGLPINAILSLLLFSLADGSTHWRSVATIITNYGQLVMPLAGFSIISQGTLGLTAHTNARSQVGRARSLILLLVSLGVVFCYFVFKQFDLGSVGSTHNPYSLPVWVMIVTLLIPSLYAWFMGLLAAYEINSYGMYVRGVLFRQPLQLMASGLVLVIGGSIATQYTRSLDAHQGQLTLDYYLVLLNLFLLLIGIGFCLIALGVNRLKKIEDV